MTTNERDMSVLDKFTEHLKKSLLAAQNLAASLNAPDIQPIHLLYGLTALKGSISRELLIKAGIEQKTLQQKIVELDRPGFLESLEPENMDDTPDPEEINPLPNLGTESRNIIERAVVLSAEYKHKYIGSEHLLLALLERSDAVMFDQINFQKKAADALKEQLVMILKNSSQFSEANDPGQIETDAEGNKKLPTLELLATELTDATVQANVDPVIGREQEIDRVIHILARRKKNNPVLLGDPGVGKTAIVEGLAKKIVEGKVPTGLRGKRIFSLDIGLLIAGTSFRGEFEQRLKQVLDEVKSDPDIILFIDEIHTIVGAGGSGNGALDMANILKPSLARGEVRCIGATTLEEYRRTIEGDAALERRFQPVQVDEPTPEQTVQILTGLKRSYELFHRVTIEKNAIEKAVEWSTRYIHDRFLPDKAIDLIDEASAAIKVHATMSKEEEDEEKILAEIKSINSKKQQAVLNEQYDKATTLWQKEQRFRQQLAELREKITREGLPPIGVITSEHIARVVSRLTRIPATQLLAEEKTTLATLEHDLSEAVIGQSEAVKKVSQAIRLGKLGFSPENRPLGSFLFLGPSGVGKTELAKQIAKLIFGDEKALLRFDMSEYGESFTVSKLIGAPAGYVGYKESGKLTEAIRRRPHAVVLFDEVEKAHPDVYNLFLQVLDDGHLTDSTGKTVSFEHAIIVFTSNIGLDAINQHSLGFATEAATKTEKEEGLTDETKRKAMKELDYFFRLEFINRLDNVVVFESLSKKDLAVLAKRHIKELEHRLRQYRLKLMLSPQASTFIAEQSFSPEKGARAVKQYLKEQVENRIAEMLVNDTIKTGQKITISVDKGKLIIK